MENLMIPVMPANAPGPIRAEVKSIGRADKSSSFSDYLERKMVAEPNERKSLLGVEQDSVARVAANNEKVTQPAAKSTDDVATQNASLHALLGQFLAEIRSQAQQNNDVGPGSWTFTLPDASQLAKLADDAGMSEMEKAALMQQLEASHGTVELGSFLTALVNHFQTAQNEQPVTVAETGLSFLDQIMARMGVPAEQIQAIDEKSVTSDNQLDLAKFLEALGNAQATQPTTLSDWEGEQLQDLLDEAGVSKLMQRALLPERHTPWDTPNQPLQPVAIDMDRLRNLLAQGLQDVAASERKPDIPNLLTDLKAIFAQAGFTGKSVGWTPAVQKAVEETYQTLLQNVDLATVQMQQVPGDQAAMALPQKPTAAPKNSDAALPVETAKEEAMPAVNQGALAKAEAVAANALAAEPPQEAAKLATPHEESSPRHAATVFSVGAELVRPEQQATAQDAKTLHNLPRLTPGWEQQTVERITEGVVRGLRTDEHHLVLRLYPKELGEVKVEMMVRDDHVAVSFAMENSRVKEVLEKHMNMFQQNLERQGFTLEGCMVSVNQQHDGNTEAWRQFVQDWQERRGEAGQKTGLAEVTNDAPYLRTNAWSTGESGINLFA